MKRAFLLIVVPALLVALGFAQTPAASINTDPTNIKGCLGSSDGNYTIVQDNTCHIFKITTSTVDLKSHLGHDVTLIGQRASGANAAAADNSFTVTELTMISEHCAAAAAAPAAIVSTPSETASTPPPAAAAAPAATTSAVAETVVTPNVAAAAPAATVTTPAETVVTPAPTAAAPAEIVVTPAATATPPAETVVTPAPTAAAPVETASTPAARHRRPSETPAVATTAPDVTAKSSSETASTPTAAGTTTSAADASTPSETASTPPAAATPPAATSRSWSVMFLIAFAVLVIAIGTMVPVFGKWRKRKLLERTGAQNLSFTREESSDKNKIDKPEPRKAA